jgi:hypothetical protein
MYASDHRKDAEEGLERIIENKRSIIEDQWNELIHIDNYVNNSESESSEIKAYEITFEVKATNNMYTRIVFGTSQKNAFESFTSVMTEQEDDDCIIHRCRQHTIKSGVIIWERLNLEHGMAQLCTII